MSSQDTRTLISQAIGRFGEDVPALKSLKLVLRLRLEARGDVPVWRVELPGRQVTKDPAADARLDLSIPRSFFNEMVKDGRLADWVEAYEHGYVKVSGDPTVVKLIGNVVERQRRREQ